MNLHAQLYNYFDIRPDHICNFLLGLAQAYHLPHPVQFLDIGCGTGRVLLPMAELGWQVVGLEPDANYFAAASKIVSQSPHIREVRQGGFDAIQEQDHYHLIAAINNPFAYLLTNATRLAALQNIYNALHAGGVIFLDFFNLLWHLRYYRQPEEGRLPLENGDILRRVIQYKIDWHASTVTHIDIFYRNDKFLSTQSHVLSIVAPPTVINLMEQVGFVNIRTYNSYAHLKPERLKNGRVMISAQKPA